MERSGMSEKRFFVMIYVEIILLSKWAQNNAIYTTGIFNGPQIRQLIRDPEFENSMKEVELEAWQAFVLVVKNFFGNTKTRNYAEFVSNILTAFRNLGCNMSVKMHYLFSHMS